MAVWIYLIVCGLALFILGAVITITLIDMLRG
jgi:hypothetical protein